MEKKEIIKLKTVRYAIMISTIFMTLFLLQVTDISLVNNVNAGSQEPAFIGEETGVEFREGDTIIENCTLSGNINCESNGFTIGADDITIDGQGYTITFVGNVPDREGFHNEGFDNVTIKNLTITNFCFGIYYKNANHGKITDNTIMYTVGSGIWLHDSSYNTVSRNNVKYGDDGHGLLVSSNAHHNIIENNTLTTGNGRGLSIEQSNHICLYHNFICGNRRGDILIEDSTGTIGDCNTATRVKADGYQDKNNGNPCTYSCQSSSSGLDTNNDLIKNAKIITSDYTFTEDIISPLSHGLVIGANNIVIDGNNFTLDGVSPGLCEDAGIQRSGIYNPGFDNLTIKNLEIKNFCNGIYLKGDKFTGDYVYENTVDNCNVHHNGNAEAGDTSTHGIKLEYVRACTIKNCSIHHNTGKGDSCEAGGNGIFLYGGENNYIFNNLVFDNTKGGIFSKMKSSFNKISFNTVTGNGQGGIILRCKLSRFSVLDHNNIKGNKGPGIYVGGPKNTLSYNTIAANEDGSSYNNDASIPNGIRISREADFTNLISNVITGHEYDICVKQELTGVYGSNNTYNTSENYDESWGMKLEKIDRSEDSNAGLPTIAPTPLMATVLVFLAVIIVVGGYMHDSSKQRNKKSFLTFEIFKRRNKK